MFAILVIINYDNCHGHIAHSNGQVQFLDLGQVLISGRSYQTIFELRPQDLLDNLNPISNNVNNLSNELENKLAKIQTPKQTKAQKAFNVNATVAPHMAAINSVLTSQLIQHIKFLAAEITVKHNRIKNFIRALSSYHLDADHDLDVSSRAKRGLFDGVGSLF